MRFSDKLKDCQIRTEKRLRFNFKVLPDSSLKEGMLYAALNGGKRLRAFLVMESSSIYGVDASVADQVASAVECMHAYSLVHDDLPSMDNDNLRRGLPTVHIKWNEATAILVGDALQSFSFKILSAQDLLINPEISNQLINSLADATGAEGMVLGQMQDIMAESSEQPLTISEIKSLQINKTGALIQWSAIAGAILSGKSHYDLEKYSKALGLAFQITDDILDIEGKKNIVGKNVNKDLEAGKATFVSLMGLDQAKQEVKMLIAEACDSLSDFGPKADGLRELARYLMLREK